jgi:hypothetical protein
MNHLRKAEIRAPFRDSSPSMENSVEPRNCCAYNETRKCILGVEIASGDFPAVTLAERLPRLTAKSGSGLWLNPFMGIPKIDVSVPLDLLYPDTDYRVIETVEFYSTFRVSPFCPPAASVLALPSHSIFASHTQPGDQLGWALPRRSAINFIYFQARWTQQMCRKRRILRCCSQKSAQAKDRTHLLWQLRMSRGRRRAASRRAGCSCF